MSLMLPLPEAATARYEWEMRRRTADDSVEGPRAFAEKRERGDGVAHGGGGVAEAGEKAFAEGGEDGFVVDEKNALAVAASEGVFGGGGGGRVEVERREIEVEGGAVAGCADKKLGGIAA